MKNFANAMDWECSGLAFLQEEFPRISMEKLKAGIFDSPQIREFIKNPMSVKMHFLQPQFNYFPKNGEDLSEEQIERFYQDIHIMEECYQDWWNVNFLADYCWCLKRDVMAAKYRRKSLKSPFIHELLLLRIFQFTMALCELSANISAQNLALFI